MVSILFEWIQMHIFNRDYNINLQRFRIPAV